MGTETKPIATRVDEEQREAMQQAADDAGLPLSTWVRVVLLAAAGVSPLRDQLTKATRAARKERSK